MVELSPVVVLVAVDVLAVESLLVEVVAVPLVPVMLDPVVGAPDVGTPVVLASVPLDPVVTLDVDSVPPADIDVTVPLSPQPAAPTAANIHPDTRPIHVRCIERRSSHLSRAGNPDAPDPRVRGAATRT